MNRELRSIERAVRYMESVDDLNPALPSLKTGVTRLQEAAGMGDMGEMDRAMKYMSRAMSSMKTEMDGMDNEDYMDMERAMKSMSRAMSSMKGNAPSHDYSTDDGEYEAAMGEGIEINPDYVDSLEEHVEYLEGQLDEHRETLRRVTECYVTAKGLLAQLAPQARVAAVMESLKAQGISPANFESLTMFESEFDSAVASVLSEGGQPVIESNQGGQPTGDGEGGPISENSDLFKNIQYLSGSLSG